MEYMDEFDLDIDGYTPDERLQSQQPYRPGYNNGSGSYTNQFGEKPYRPVTEETVAPQTNAPTPIVEDTPSRPAADAPAPQKKELSEKPKPRSKKTEEEKAAEAAAAERARQQRREERERRIRELKGEKKEKTGPGIFKKIANACSSEGMRIFIGTALLFISIFMTIAVISHFHTGAQDQSSATHLTIAQMADEPQNIENTAGGFGAWLSKVLLCDALGLGSLVLIVYLWLMALNLFGVRKCQFWGTTFRCLLMAVTISIVLGLATYNWKTEIYWGGNHGHYVNKFLLERATWIGAVLVSALLVVAVCCVYINELRHVWKKWRASVERRRLQDELRRERQRELDRLEEEERADIEQQQHQQPSEAVQEPAQSPQKKSSTLSIKSITEKFSIPGGDEAKPHKKDEEAAPQPAKEENRTEKKQADFVINPPAAPESQPGKATQAEDEVIFVIDPDNPEDRISDDTPGIDSDTTENTGVEEPAIGGNFSITAPTIEEAEEIVTEPEHSTGPYDHRAELSRFRFPSIDLLEDRPSGAVIDMAEQQANKEKIEKTLLDYKIPISRIEATVGPTVTLYEIVPAEGIRISQIKRLEDDIALSLSALGIRIIAPIPGKGTVGIEVPNNDPQTVSMRAVISSRKYQECKMALPMAMGATISNDIFIADLAKMPHLLVAGATGMGKSVGLNAIITSLIYKKHPSELKFVLIDPKMVEFSLYSRLERHYLAKLPNEEEAIITDMGKVIQTLNSLCVEMDSRYELLRNANVRSLEEYNRKFTERKLNPNDGHRYLPYIVVVVDEFADLIMTQGKEVETPISRIAQKARAVGMHMILATQRPSTNVITGLIKANFPGRIAFRVIQMVDSRTILDCPGANQLIGRGDMLFSHNGIMERVQCAFISTEEVEAITEYIDNQIGYEHAYYLPEYVPEEAEGGVIAGGSTERDSLFDEASRFVVSRQMGSTSSLQRQFGIGYNRAGKLMDQMEAAGIVGPVNGAKPRNILVDMMTLETILSQG